MTASTYGYMGKLHSSNSQGAVCLGGVQTWVLPSVDSTVPICPLLSFLGLRVGCHWVGVQNLCLRIFFGRIILLLTREEQHLKRTICHPPNLPGAAASSDPERSRA